MICPFCAAVVEGGKKHIEWHRKTDTAKADYITAIPPNAALLGEPPILCYTCSDEPGRWQYNEDVCCDEHIYTSDGYLG